MKNKATLPYFVSKVCIVNQLLASVHIFVFKLVDEWTSTPNNLVLFTCNTTRKYA